MRWCDSHSEGTDRDAHRVMPCGSERWRAVLSDGPNGSSGSCAEGSDRLGRERYRPPRGGAESFFLKPPRALDAVEAGDLQSLERIGDGAQMLGREMQVDEGAFQPHPAKVDAQSLQQLGAQRNLA